MRKTKIVATIGPASDSEVIMGQILREGADALRFNFSHGTHQQHLIAYHRARSLIADTGKAVTLIQDLQGPKIRVGKLRDDMVTLEEGQEVTITSRRIIGDESRIPVSYEYLERDVRPGEIILMDDGRLRLEATAVVEEGVKCHVVEGGPLSPHKGVNFPHSSLSSPSVTPKDREDLRFGLQVGFDAVALSFVSSRSDVAALRAEMRKHGAIKPIIAKLERAACLDNLDEIMGEADAVMVARGDLGIEVDIKRLPVLQKIIISKANSHGLPVITATQMLESMTKGMLPTRAEAADVANAVFDGADALMLSGETSVGLFPTAAVRMMHEIVTEAESFAAGVKDPDLWRRRDYQGRDIPNAICHTAVVAAHDLKLENIVVVTMTGQTALDVSKFRPTSAIHAFSPDRTRSNFLALSRAVIPHHCDLPGDFEELMNFIDAQLIEKGIAQIDEVVAVSLGLPLQQHKGTNTLIIHRVGHKHRLKE
ncbi:MAG: pyruvate kinase [Deltaproteobacteria bacterium]|nr:pyruvate kinase [Deltaproteobacteria bacterium]